MTFALIVRLKIREKMEVAYYCISTRLNMLPKHNLRRQYELKWALLSIAWIKKTRILA